MKVRALVLAGYGINCEAETRLAFERAGATATIMHLGDLVESPAFLRDQHILAVPGGFSFGDDVASGKILANRLRYRLGEPLREFIAARKLIIGICNGFQVLVKMGILPLFGDDFVQETTLTHNDSGRFEDRWVHVAVDPASVCVWTRGIKGIELPVRHGEGKFLARNQGVRDRLSAAGQIALRYATADGGPAKGVYPANPNGSLDDVAGICDPSGRIFGLMPHPEAFLEGTNHPRWTREGLQPEGAGLAIFRNGVAHAAQQFASVPAARR
jgi:phosphoribosylformylglycinamidine synthase I